MNPSHPNIFASDTPESTLAGLQHLAEYHGFGQIGISDADTSAHHQFLEQWLAEGKHGDMQWMENHLSLRKNPSELVANAKRVISVRLDYLPQTLDETATALKQQNKAYISRYALGRDYHKMMRKKLTQLAADLNRHFNGNYRATVDSAPVLERHFAEKAGLGWIGKNTMMMNRQAGSWFFLGEIITDADIPLETADPAKNHCGRCTACLDVCPTQAFDDAYKLDATKCISYLTIELKGAIPEHYRKAMGNRVFGCDDCQLVCPWNRFAKQTEMDDFKPRHGLDTAELTELFLWDETTFLNNTAGSAIRRLGHERWLRNVAVGLGNAETTTEVVHALEQRLNHPSPLVQEHVQWALAQHKINTCT